MDADTREIIAAEKAIKKFSKRGVPIAQQQTLTATARNAYNHGQKIIAREFNTRNQWTQRGQSWQRAQGLDVSKMKSEYGTANDYMRKQEEGFTQTAKAGVMIPTAESSGEAAGGKRSKPIRKRLRRSSITLSRRKRGRGTEKQRRIAGIIDTLKSGNRFWWGKMAGTLGMWQFKGTISKKTGWPKMKPKLLYSADYKRVTTKPTKWMEPAADAAMKDQPKEYKKALDRQLDRYMNKK